MLVGPWHWSTGLRPGAAPRQLPRRQHLAAGFARQHVRRAAVTERNLGDAASAYLALSRGYKAGGFNLGTVAGDTRSFDPEYLWNLETGIKAALGSRGHADIAVFYEKRHDQQVRTGVQLTPGDPNSYQFITTNLPKGYGTGIEASLQYELTRGLGIGASLGCCARAAAPSPCRMKMADPVHVASRENAHAPRTRRAQCHLAWQQRFHGPHRFHGDGFLLLRCAHDHDMKSKAYTLTNLKAGYEHQHWSVYAAQCLRQELLGAWLLFRQRAARLGEQAVPAAWRSASVRSDGISEFLNSSCSRRATLLTELWTGLKATSIVEWIADATGVAYALLVMWQRRSGWVFGGVSCLILAVLFWQVHLPMQALLQLSYVVAAVYGWVSWSKAGGMQPISLWHWRGHAMALAACVLVSLLLAHFLAHESAAPFADSLVFCLGIFATWLLARVYLENWAYWILIDAVSIVLAFRQGLVSVAVLYVLYLGIAVSGLAAG